MIAVNSWGKRFYIDEQLAGYIAPSGDLYSKDGEKFGGLTDRGEIFVNYEQVGYISNDYCIYVNGINVGIVAESGDIKINSKGLAEANKDK